MIVDALMNMWRSNHLSVTVEFDQMIESILIMMDSPRWIPEPASRP